MKWGPTWANTLPLRIVYVTTPVRKGRLLRHLQPGNVGRASAAPVNAILAARAAGLAVEPMGGFDPAGCDAGLDAEFFPDGDWRSILIVNIGHPGDSPWFDRLPRLDYEEAARHA
jgi:3-hydroxypropanoate dehydrogenase